MTGHLYLCQSNYFFSYLRINHLLSRIGFLGVSIGVEKRRRVAQEISNHSKLTGLSCLRGWFSSEQMWLLSALIMAVFEGKTRIEQMMIISQLNGIC